MPGIASISSELAGGDTSLADLDAQLDLFEPALAPSLDAVITSAALNPDSTLNEADQDDRFNHQPSVATVEREEPPHHVHHTAQDHPYCCANAAT